MKNTAKKAVVLHNFSSPYISEAIIILKDYNPALEGKIITDAEKIVSAYIEKQERNKEKENYAVRVRGLGGAVKTYKKSGQHRTVRRIVFFLVMAAAIAAAVYFAGTA